MNEKLPSLTKIIGDLYSMYSKESLTVYGCISPFLCNNFVNLTGSNYIGNNEFLLSSSGGISNEEAIFIYNICENILPKNILIIGNSYGFSTVFLSLANPKSKVVAFDKFRTKGIEITNKILKDHKEKYVIQASTPEDLETITLKHFNGVLDLVLVDGVHENEYQTKEFEILNKYMSKKSAFVFHDVISCNLIESFNFLKNKYDDYLFKLVHKSTSGMAICIKGEIDEDFNNFINYYSQSESEIFSLNEMFIKFSNKSTEQIFKNIFPKLKFPPHPQL